MAGLREGVEVAETKVRGGPVTAKGVEIATADKDEFCYAEGAGAAS